jgi:hypothetical protein
MYFDCGLRFGDLGFEDNGLLKAGLDGVYLVSGDYFFRIGDFRPTYSYGNYGSESYGYGNYGWYGKNKIKGYA